MLAMNSAAAAALSPAPARRRAIAMWPLGVIAFAGFGIWGPASWAAVASFSVLASGSLVALAIGWKEQGRRGDVRAAALVDNEPAFESVGGPLESLLVDVLPVWQSHVGQVKSQTEQAITQLVISFASITAQFEAAGFKGAHGDSSGVEYSLLTLCERELQPVIAVMTEILDSKKLLTACVHDLSSATAELSSMAAEVAHIAWHTNLLAINAAVEAAHAGDSGRGFGVIAKEIRSLSQTSAAAGKRIAGRIGEVERLMGSAIAVADETEANDRIVIDMSARVIADVLSHVRELGEGAEAMRAQGNVIRADTENLLVNLQFQDRVSQMTVVIDQDIERLHQLVVAGEAIPTSDAWLRELDLHYTMDDQRQSAASPTGATAAAVADDVLFF